MRPGDLTVDAAIDALSDSVIVTDARWRIVLVNQGTLRMFRYDRAELLGRCLDVLLPTAAPGAQLLGRRKDGVEFLIEIRVHEAPSSSGPLEIVCVRDSIGSSNGGSPARHPERPAPSGPVHADTINESRNALGILVSRIDVMLLEADQTPLPVGVGKDLAVLQRAAARLAISLERLLSTAHPDRYSA